MHIVDYNYSTYQELVRDLLTKFQQYEQVNTFRTELWVDWIDEAQEVISTFLNVPRIYSLTITSGISEYDLSTSKLKQVVAIKRANGRAINVVSLELLHQVQHWDTLFNRTYKTDEVPFWAAEKVEIGQPKKIIFYPAPTATSEQVTLVGYLGFVAKLNTSKALADEVAIGSIYNDVLKSFVKMRVWENLVDVDGADTKAKEYKLEFYQMLGELGAKRGEAQQAQVEDVQREESAKSA